MNKVKTQRITWIENYPLEAPARLAGRRMKRVFKEEFGDGKGRRGGNKRRGRRVSVGPRLFEIKTAVSCPAQMNF